MKQYLAGAAARLLVPMLVAGAALTAASCSKKEDPQTVAAQPDNSAADDAAIQKYVADNNLTRARKLASGLYYVPVITNPNGVQATAGRDVTVTYAGTLLDGTAFDAGDIPFRLGTGQVIRGWDEGIALMRLSEKSILLIPSGLAYGAKASGKVPANAVLRFDVTLTKIQ